MFSSAAVRIYSHTHNLSLNLTVDKLCSGAGATAQVMTEGIIAMKG